MTECIGQKKSQSVLALKSASLARSIQERNGEGSGGRTVVLGTMRAFIHDGVGGGLVAVGVAVDI